MKSMINRKIRNMVATMHDASVVRLFFGGFIGI